MRRDALGVTILSLTMSACAPQSQSVEAQRARIADGAKVAVRKADGTSLGTLTLSTHSSGGVGFNGRLSGLPAGTSGVHIHENGQCDPPDFKSAGGHFNPQGKQHGQMNPQGKHAGDLGNLRVGPNGSTEVSLVADLVSLGEGPNSLLKEGGTSFVIHAQADDLKTDPSGDSGDRIACGVITR